MELANHMDEVAKMFGKKLEDEFEVSVAGEFSRHKCKFTLQGVYYWDDDFEDWVFDCDEILHDLLTGGALIHEA